MAVRDAAVGEGSTVRTITSDEYVARSYQNLKTCIRIGKRRSKPILFQQGNPLFAILFNLVIDEVLDQLDEHIGYCNEEDL